MIGKTAFAIGFFWLTLSINALAEDINMLAITLNPTPIKKVDAQKPATNNADPLKGGELSKPATPLDLDSKLIAIGGRLAEPAAWSAYKTRFLTAQGRIIDTANNDISHSEGQGYGMLLAVAANDRDSFERIWGWTRANLMIRDDGLLAWRFDADKRPGVTDINNATDGDILVTWALAEAAEFWSSSAYSAAARRLAASMAQKVMLRATGFGDLLLPAVAGFNAKVPGSGDIINLSYFIFPAFARLKEISPDRDWSSLVASGLRVLRGAKFGASKLPSEWIRVDDKKLTPASGFPAVFGYNSIRIPLYLALAGVGEREDYAPFEQIWRSAQEPMAVIDLASGKPQSLMGEPGYSAIAALTACVTENKPFLPIARTFSSNQNYFPATLQLLSLLAAKLRFPSCVSN